MQEIQNAPHACLPAYLIRRSFPESRPHPRQGRDVPFLLSTRSGGIGGSVGRQSPVPPFRPTRRDSSLTLCDPRGPRGRARRDPEMEGAPARRHHDAEARAEGVWPRSSRGDAGEEKKREPPRITPVSTTTVQRRHGSRCSGCVARHPVIHHPLLLLLLLLPLALAPVWLSGESTSTCSDAGAGQRDATVPSVRR